MALISGNKYRNFQQDVSKKKEKERSSGGIRSRALVNTIVTVA